MIGSAQEYQKNKDENRFPTDYELKIPVGETTQGRAIDGPQSGSFNEDDLIDAIDDIDGSSNDYQRKNNNPNDMGRKRTSAAEEFVRGTDNCLSAEPKTKRPSLYGENDPDAQYLPLSCVNTFIKDWVIKVKITKVGYRTYQNFKGSGTILSMDLMDKQGV
jgi:hypothetical protein